MVPTASRPVSFGFTTQGMPAAERLTAWRESFGRLVHVDIDPLGGAPFNAKAEFCDLREAVFASVTCSPLHADRTAEMARDGRDDISLIVLLSGAAVVSQAGRDMTLAKEGAAFLRNAEPGSVRFTAPSRSFNLCVPGSALARPAGSGGPALPAGPSDGEALRLLLGYARLLRANADTATVAALQLAAGHMRDLMALTIGTGGEAAERALKGGLRAGRLAAIKADIAQNLGRLDLTAATVAARQRISPRYVRKLFEEEGTSFSEFVRSLRLARAQRLLTDPRFAQCPVSTIAFEVGFSDLSYFNRCFRRRYGLSPTAMRAETNWAGAR